MKTPLYNYNSPNNAYVVDDYPYGRLRCQIKYYLEKDDKKGFRFVSQTENPKTLVWNNPKKSTYQRFAGCMYLDDKGHTHWSGLSEYSSVEDVARFLEEFPEADVSLLKPFVVAKLVFARGRAEGKAVFVINDVPQIPNDRQIEEAQKDLVLWREICNKLGVIK